MKFIFACAVIGLLYWLAVNVDKLMKIIDKHEDIIKSNKLDK